ncbi:MAG: TonB-dependent receptor plug domain-containing protein [Flavobacteriales bacterium]
MIRFFVCFLFVFLLFPFFSQSKEINGKVLDNQKKPIPFAHVMNLTDSTSAVCDFSGNFKMTIGNLATVLKASSVGFHSEELNFSINNYTTPITFILKENNDILKEMVISATLQLIDRKESPIPIAVYSAQFLNAVPSPSLVQATNQITGLRPQFNCSVCNTGDIHINGMEGAYSMIVIDGMPIMGGLSTVYGLQGIPTSLIDQVEVIKGPASTVYGSEAMAGLINVVTKNIDCVPKFSLDFNISSWGELQTSIVYKLIDKQRLKAFSSIDIFNYNNPIDNNDDGFTDLSLKNRYSIFNKFQFFNKNGYNPLNLTLRYLNEDRWGGQMNFTEQDRGKNTVYGETILTNRVEASSFYKFSESKNLKWQNSFSFHDQKSWYGLVKYEAKQIIGFSQLTWHKSLGEKNNFLSGFALRYNSYNDNTVATLKADNWWLPGFFLQDNFKFSDNQQLLFGWRTDFHSKHGVINSPRINYQLNITDNSSLRIGYGDGFRVVNVFTEDHAALTGAREIIFLEELEPEKSKNLNINFSNSWNTDNLQITLESSVFESRFSNKIIPDFLTNDNQIIYSNLSGYAVARGISSEIFLKMYKIPLKLSANATVLDVSNYNENSTGEIVKNQQLLAEKYSIKWSLNYWFEKLGLDIVYSATNYGPIRLPILENDFRPEYSLPYTIHNLKLSKNYNNGWTNFISIRNFTNFTPPNYSILRANDPFDQNINDPIDNPEGYTFDASYMYASFQGINLVFGVSFVF